MVLNEEVAKINRQGFLKKKQHVNAGTDLQPHAGHLLPRTTKVLRRTEGIPRLAVAHYHLEQREG